MKSKQKGFTLIELLVVIAIIGLLAGIVLVSLGGARESARNARIQGAAQQIRSMAELVANANTPANYLGTVAADSLCDATDSINNAQTDYATELGNIEADIVAQSGDTGPANICFVAADDYCIEAGLAGTAEIFCIDSTGISRQQVAGTCTTVNHDCTP